MLRRPGQLRRVKNSTPQNDADHADQRRERCVRRDSRYRLTPCSLRLSVVCAILWRAVGSIRDATIVECDGSSCSHDAP